MYNIDERISRLKSRRNDGWNEALLSRGYYENFESRTNQKATKYALGAMQEVNKRSTEISIEEFEKVRDGLKSCLPGRGFNPDFRLQGSVACNIHIKGVSDVDMLEVNGDLFTYSTGGARGNLYTPSQATASPASEVLKMRSITESELEKRYYAATIDKSNAKSIQLSGGSFRRKVDVVPSHWHDGEDYQLFREEKYRGIVIVNKKNLESI